MKTASTFFLGLLLSVCLALYGPFSMAKAQGGAVFSMEICADGFSKTVPIDAAGNPVEPSHDCHKCLTCCQAIGVLTPTACAPALSDFLFQTALGSPQRQDPIQNKRNIFPAPRGPPAVPLSVLNSPDLTTIDQPVMGRSTRSDGRPLFKDASA